MRSFIVPSYVQLQISPTAQQKLSLPSAEVPPLQAEAVNTNPMTTTSFEASGADLLATYNQVALFRSGKGKNDFHKLVIAVRDSKLPKIKKKFKSMKAKANAEKSKKSKRR